MLRGQCYWLMWFTFLLWIDVKYNKYFRMWRQLFWCYVYMQIVWNCQKLGIKSRWCFRSSSESRWNGWKMMWRHCTVCSICYNFEDLMQQWRTKLWFHYRESRLCAREMRNELYEHRFMAAWSVWERWLWWLQTHGSGAAILKSILWRLGSQCRSLRN